MAARKERLILLPPVLVRPQLSREATLSPGIWQRDATESHSAASCVFEKLYQSADFTARVQRSSRVCCRRNSQYTHWAGRGVVKFCAVTSDCSQWRFIFYLFKWFSVQLFLKNSHSFIHTRKWAQCLEISPPPAALLHTVLNILHGTD